MRRMYFVAMIVGLGCSASSGGAPADATVDDQRAPLTHGVSTLAGWAEAGYVDGDRQTNLFANPVNVLVAGTTLYVADFDNNKLRALDMAGNASTIIAAPGFQRPFGLVQSQGVLYVQTDNDASGTHSTLTGTLWKIDAGTATPLLQGIGRPRGLAALADGRLALADYTHHVVEIFDPATNTLSTLAGTWDTPGFADGAAALFDAPYGLVQRGDGSLVVTDWANHRLRVVALDGTVSTLAGGDAGFADGALADARFDHPQGIAMTSDGDLYITDTDNWRVRWIHGGSVQTIAGNGIAGYADGDDPHAAELYGLEGLSVAADGSMVFVADGSRGEDVPHNRVRTIARLW